MNIEVSPGERTQFLVKAEGVPRPQVKWYREVRRISNLNMHELTQKYLQVLFVQ